MDGEEAKVQATRQFLAVNAPATREDVARWWAVSPARAKRRIQALGDQVEEVIVDGEAMWMLRGDAKQVANADSGGRSA